MSNYIGCICCGYRYVEDKSLEYCDTRCPTCYSSVIVLQKDLSEEVEKVLKEFGQNKGIEQ